MMLNCFYFLFRFTTASWYAVDVDGTRSQADFLHYVINKIAQYSLFENKHWVAASALFELVDGAQIPSKFDLPSSLLCNSVPICEKNYFWHFQEPKVEFKIVFSQLVHTKSQGMANTILCQ